MYTYSIFKIIRAVPRLHKGCYVYDLALNSFENNQLSTKEQAGSFAIYCSGTQEAAFQSDSPALFTNRVQGE